MVGFSVFLGYAGDIRDSGSIPGSERSPGEENGYPLQYSCLEWLGGLQSMGLQRVDIMSDI